MFDSFTKSLSFNPLAPLEDVYNIWNNERNYRFQRENYEYQKDLQNKIFEREDSSLQRRVADAEAAGLNPQLALGSGSSAGQAISTSAPQHEPMKLDFLEKAIDLQKRKAELDLLESENEGKKKQNSLLDLQKAIDEHNFKYYKDNHWPTNANGQYVQILQALGSILDGLKGNDSGVVSKLKDFSEKIGEKYEKNNPSDEDLPFNDDYTFEDSIKKSKSTPERFINWIKAKKQQFSEYRKKRMEAYDKKKKNIFGN